jgi:hypothetical protein
MDEGEEKFVLKTESLKAVWGLRTTSKVEQGYLPLKTHPWVEC